MFHKLGLSTYYGPNFICDLAEISDEMLPYSNKAFESYIEGNEYCEITSSEIWYQERTDFSKEAVGTERISHREEHGFELLQGKECFEELRFGFVIVDSKKRGQGYGKNMLKLGLKYFKEIFGANKVSLGVFENNESAYYCYKAIGFEDVSQDEIEKYTVMGEEWNCLELEMKL